MNKTAPEYRDLMEAIEKTGRSYDLDLITRAYDKAYSAHGGQKRKSGDSYISHPVAACIILVELGMDNESLAAALLHDVVEDTGISLNEIEKDFGETVAHLVDGVTKLGRIPFSTNEEQQAENVRKMLLAMSEDIRVIIIKLADRLHNMRTLQFMTPQKQRDKAKETMEVYAPIAHRLGMLTIKEELEDTSLHYLDPVAYDEILNLLESKRTVKGDFLEDIKQKIEPKISFICKDMKIETRVKSIYGIYRKMYMQGKSFDEIYDIYALRIIVDTVEECYTVLGHVHEMYRLIPNRFKDYISTPKQNMYQSLHTTVIGKEGVPFEVQIRTWKMHQDAEYGIAAHWKYKTGITAADDKLDKRLSWVREMLNNQQDSVGSEEIVSTIKTDLSQEDIFVLTPKGDVRTLPSGSTIVDFAYAIHSAVGNKMIGAKVDGRIVPLDYQLKTGEIVEILTTKAQGHGPSRDWLKIVKTSEARGKIRSWFKKEKREENIIEGRAELEKELKRSGVNFPPEQYEKFIDSIVKRQYLNSDLDLYAAIGYGGVRLNSIVYRAKEEYQKYKRSLQGTQDQLPALTEHRHKSNGGVYVEGLENCLIKFARCCTPLPGEPIVGFVTRGYGVSIHRADCVNAVLGMQDEEQKGRWLKAEWEDKTAPGNYKVTLSIFTVDRNGILADISVLLSGMHLPIFELNARVLKDKTSNIVLTTAVNSLEQMQSVMTKLRAVKDVLKVERTGTVGGTV